MDLSRRNLLLGLGGAALSAVSADLLQSNMSSAAVPALRGASWAPVAPMAPLSSTPMATPLPLTATSAIKRVALHNLHTGDKLDAVFYENGKYVPDALHQAMRVLRDWRNGEEHVMEPELFDVLHGISERLEVDRPFQIISGYRSPKTNAAMHAESSEVATHSQHTLGKASDIRIQGVDLSRLHAAAVNMRAGGVGFYPVSNFVHVDVGPVRTWSGT